ncbi:MAG TPA: N-acetyltransferase [Lysobacter sp.]
MAIRIRHELPGDVPAIEQVTVEAFRTAGHASGTESFIVRALRDARQLTVSLVAEHDGALVGYVAASPVVLSSGAPGWHGLGPVAVLPRCQRRGTGTQLIRAALAELRAAGAAGCVVLGEPRYYARFGFRSNAALRLAGVPAGYFQALAFRGRLPAGEVVYHEAFSARG